MKPFFSTYGFVTSIYFTKHPPLLPNNPISNSLGGHPDWKSKCFVFVLERPSHNLIYVEHISVAYKNYNFMSVVAFDTEYNISEAS
jgi:hypothetical protein